MLAGAGVRALALLSLTLGLVACQPAPVILTLELPRPPRIALSAFPSGVWVGGFVAVGPVATQIDAGREATRIIRARLARQSIPIRWSDEDPQTLILTGRVTLDPLSRSGLVQRLRETFDEFGRRTVEETWVYRDRMGYRLTISAVWIDARTGQPILTETHMTERLDDSQRMRPILEVYYDLLDRLLSDLVEPIAPSPMRSRRALLVQ